MAALLVGLGSTGGARAAVVYVMARSRGWASGELRCSCAGARSAQLNRQLLSPVGASMRIEVSTIIDAPIALVWGAYSNPDDIVQWNAASDDWHTTRSSVDFRVGGTFCSRMEAKDGSFGFDFEGRYTRIEAPRLIEYDFGDRKARVDFTELPEGVRVQVSFDAEDSHSLEQQRSGWQAILDRFKQHVEARA
jgi:uncharacterized protein YndB with AHSA1/START domain